MATTKSLGKKNQFDKFYTKPEIAEKLLGILDLNKFQTIIEPSAGNGSFSKLIPNCIALDIKPEDESILRQDFLTYSPPLNRGSTLVIGNPPFGEQSKIAIEFFRHAADFADTIAFILPKSFRKISIQNKLPLTFGLKYEQELPKTSFLLNGEPYDVPCVFQVWEKQTKPRKKIILPTTSPYFTFTKSITEADFRIQRVGGNAGKAFSNKDGAASSNYYLVNTSSVSTPTLVELPNQVRYESLDDTVGPRSLPKGELVYFSTQFLDTIIPQ